MEGAPNFEQQPTGPFAWRNRFNEVVKFCRAMALARFKDGGKIVYGENEIVFDPGNGSGHTFQIVENGYLMEYTINATFIRQVPP